MKSLEDLRPTEKPTVMELVARAGLDTSDWQNYAKGPANASANPKYCYEWCFEQEGIFVLNIWYENIEIDSKGVCQRLNVRAYGKNQGGVRKTRAERFETIAKTAFELGSNPRVIILDREKRGEGSARARMLDKAPWTVVSWNPQGDLELRRGIHDVTQHLEDVDDPELGQFKEGELRQSFVKHRAREWKLRAKKLDEFSRKHGRIFCEVPRCGFDFKTIYGSVGEGFAEVHHLDPLGSSPAGGQISSLDRLSVVCSNCHRMIHRGGECRRLETLLETK